MKLSFEQIKSITFGTTDLWQEDDGIHFRRCTQAQIDSWYASRENLGDGSTRTTGICFDFITDSPWFSLIFAGSNKLDILVDGYDEELEQFYGRTYADSPDIDGRVWLASDEPLKEGSFVKVRIDGCVDGDLSGYVLEDME